MSVREELEVGFLGKLTNPKDLQTIINIDNVEAAKACLVSPETYRRWLSDRKPNKTAIKLLCILAGRSPWPGWERFSYSPYDHKIYADDLKYGFTPGDLYSMFYLRQGFEYLECENKKLRERVEELEQNAADLEAQV